VNILTELFFGQNHKFYQQTLKLEGEFLNARKKCFGSFTTNLPKVKKKSTVINDIKFEQGDIVERPMYNALKKVHLKHYGYYYGTDANGVDYIVNKEADGFIYVRTLEEYMKEINYNEVDIIKKPEGTKISEIIKRSKQIEDEPYTALHNNCQHFVNYSVFEKYTSLTVDIMKNELIDKVKHFRAKIKGIKE
jgi:hypothetical protein